MSLFPGSIRIGAMVKTKSGDQEVVATIAAVEVENRGPSPRRVFVVDLLGEIVPTADGGNEFRRGVSLHPIPGAPVLATIGCRHQIRLHAALGLQREYRHPLS